MKQNIKLNNLFCLTKNGSSGAKTGLFRWAGARSKFPGDTRNVGGRRGLSYVCKKIQYILCTPGFFFKRRIVKR